MKVLLSKAYQSKEAEFVGSVDTRPEGDIVLELERRLNSELVHFIFEKADGEIRHAYGTRAPRLLPAKLVDQLRVKQADYEKANNEHGISVIMNAVMLLEKEVPASYTPNPEFVNYWDFTANGWRKFKNTAIVAILN